MDSKLLQKFYRNECTPEEVKEVLRWFEQEKPRQEEEQAMNLIWQEAERDKEEPAFAHDADRILENILAKKDLATSQEPGGHTSVRQLYPVTWKKYLRIAAALLIPVLGISLLFVRYRQHSAGQMVTVEAQPGVRKTVTLADGSVVKLHSGSSLSYPERFGDTREISLSGEAFFEVAKDSLRPFVVHTGQVSTQALGTSFNISYEDKDSTVSIALATGLVKIEHKSAERARQLALLEPGQQLVYHKQAQRFEVSDFDREKVLGWKEGVLHFQDASLTDVVEELERWYGVQVEVEGQALSKASADWHYTGKYEKQSLEAVLQGISFVKKVSYRRSGDGTIILSAGKKP